MNKRVLKSYMNNKKDRHDILKTSCFKCNDKFVISDSNSLIILNDNYDLDIKDDTLGLLKFKENFENNFEVDYTFMAPLENNDEMYEPIDESYGINIKLFNKINKVIKGNSYAIMKNKDKLSYTPYIIRLENTKTKEYGYMLPMRKF